MTQRCIYILVFLASHVLLHGQHGSGTSLDVEFETYCMIDSISPGNEVEFVRMYYYNKDSYKDVTADLSSSYTVLGTALPCWQLTGSKECWLFNHTVEKNRYGYGLGAGQLPDKSDDYWLVALRIREHYDLLMFSKRTETVIPLNYPYGNNTSEAARLKADLEAYFDCKGICASLVTVNVGTYSISPTIEIMWFAMGTATYTASPAAPNPIYVDDNAFLTLLGNSSCSMVHDVYRKEKNGAILYYVDPDGVLNAPPLPFSAEKVPCSEETERIYDCDRPSGSNECWAATLENPLCSYTFIIPDSLELDSVWIDGVQFLSETFCPVSTDVNCPTHFFLRDTLQDYYNLQNYWGEFSVDNTVNGKPGFIITLNYSDRGIDSIRTGDGNTIYPIIEDCRTFSNYSVSRNELGGIVKCTDQFGHNMYCPPSSARMVSCESASGKAGCRVQGKWGTEVVTSSTTYDISKFWSFSYIVKDTPATIQTLNYAGDTISISCPKGYSERFTSGDECKLLQSEFFKVTATGGGEVKVSYGW